MKTYTKKDFQQWGSIGGRKSKRKLTPEQARAMTQARLVKSASCKKPAAMKTKTIELFAFAELPITIQRQIEANSVRLLLAALDKLINGTEWLSPAKEHTVRKILHMQEGKTEKEGIDEYLQSKVQMLRDDKTERWSIAGENLE